VARSLALNRSIVARASIFGGGLVCGVGLTALIIANIGLGQSPATNSMPAPSSAPPAAGAPALIPAAPEPASPALSSDVRAAVDERVAQLQSQLGITAAQMPLWSVFAAVMRDNAAATDVLFARRAGTVATMSAVENMHSYAGIARAYADDTQRLATAFDPLYETLSEAQKRAADTLFREQAAAAAKPQ
jgi:periplasmic protein CpxP/Spy